MKELGRRDFLKSLAAGALGAASVGLTGGVAALAQETGQYTPGTYSATAMGMGEIKVSMTFDANSITAVSIDTSAETAGIGQGIEQQFIDAILATQSVEVDAVSGATVTSEAIRKACQACVAQATGAPVETQVSLEHSRVPGYCGPGDWLGQPPVIDDSQIEQTINTDVLVLGMGHAGLLAALGAVDQGARVAVVETQPWSAFVDLTSGANAGGWYGSEIGHVNSQFMIDKGFGPYNEGEVAYEFVKRTGGRCNPDILRAYTQNSGKMFDRMVEIYNAAYDRRKAEDVNVLTNAELTGKDGVYCDYSEMLTYPQLNIHTQWDENTQYPILSGDYKTWPTDAQFYGHQGNNIEYFNKYVKYYCEDKDAQFFFEHSGVVLTQDGEGAVTGAIVRDVNSGAYKKFTAKGVVLATGDFCGDKDMCWALLNEYMEYAERAGKTSEDWAATKTRDGAGHKMGCWAGGVIETTPRGGMVIGGGASGPWGQHPFLQLNAQGKRWYNEAGMPWASPISWRQTPGMSCFVTDKKLKQSLHQGGLEHGAPNWGWKEQVEHMWETFGQVEVGNPEGGFVSGIAVAESYAYMGGTIYAANTLEELADFMGYTGKAKENFLASIDRYNQLCRAGLDADYGKDAKFMLPIDEPPFYGGVGNLTNTPMTRMVTLAGLIADEYMRVAKGGDTTQPIKGLYACGNCLGGRYGMGYTTPIPGNSIGMAMTHGWLAGQYAAQGV